MGKRLLASLTAACAILTLAHGQTTTNVPSLAPAPVDTNPPLSTLPDNSTLPATTGILPADPSLMPAATTNAPAAKPKPKKPKPVNVIGGKISSLDKTNMTVTVEGKKKSHTYAVTSASRFTKAGKPATFADVAVGEQVRGTFAKVKAGGERVASLELSPSAPKTAAATAPHKATHKKKAKSVKKAVVKPADAGTPPATIPAPLETVPAPAPAGVSPLPAK